MSSPWSPPPSGGGFDDRPPWAGPAPGDPTPPRGPGWGGSNGALLALALLGVVGLLVGAGFFVATLQWPGTTSTTMVLPVTTATPPTSTAATVPTTVPTTTGPAPTTTPGGSGIPVGRPGPAEVTHRAGGFSFGHAGSWRISTDDGGKPRARIEDDRQNQISVFVFGGQQDARAKCRTETLALKIFVPGTMTELPDITMAGQPAPGYHLRGSSKTYVLRCVLRGTDVYNLTYQSSLADEQAVADVFATASSTFAFT